MDLKPKAEPLADDCIAALTDAYCPEGTETQSEQAAGPTPIMLSMNNGSGGSQDMMPPSGVTGGMRGPNEAVSSSSEFNHEAIMLLIEAMAARWDLYGQRERSRLFQSVQQELEGHGYPLPVERIRRKWNNLIVTYKRVKERSRCRGQARTSWEYYEIMDSVLGKGEMSQGSSSASATLLGLATTAQTSVLCEDPSTSMQACLFPNNLITTATQVPTYTPQRPIPSMTPPGYAPAPTMRTTPPGTAVGNIDHQVTNVATQPKITLVPTSRRKPRRVTANTGGPAMSLGQPQAQPYRRGPMMRGYVGDGDQRALLEEQRQCRQEARERRRERTANRVAEAVTRMATALELISSKQDTIIALLQRMADKH